MELFGIGPLELLFILIIALIVLGPKDMVKAGHTLGRFLRKTILSPTWLNIQREVRNLPYQMMREAGLEESDLRIDPGLNRPVNEPNIITRNPQQADPGATPQVPAEWLSIPDRQPAPLPDSSEDTDSISVAPEWIQNQAPGEGPEKTD